MLCITTTDKIISKLGRPFLAARPIYNLILDTGGCILLAPNRSADGLNCLTRILGALAGWTTTILPLTLEQYEHILSMTCFIFTRFRGLNLHPWSNNMTLPKVQQIPNNHYHWFKTYRSIDWIIPSANPFVHSFVFIRVGQMMPPLHWVSAAMGEQCQTKQMEMYDDVQMWKCHWWMTFITETSIIFKKPTNCNFRLTNTHLMSSKVLRRTLFPQF